MKSVTKPGGLTGLVLSANTWLVFAFFYAPIALLVLFSFVVGVAALRLDRRRLLLLLFLVFYNSLHIVTHGFARYRLPAMPVVFR